MPAKHPKPEPHANKRARQRYGMRIKPGDYEKIVALITQGHATLIDKGGFKCKYQLEFRGKQILVGYDDVLKRIITFLPMPRTPIK